MKHNTFIGVVSIIALGILAIVSFVFLPVLANAAIVRSTLQTPTTACVNGDPEVSLKWSATVGATSYSVFRNYANTSWLVASSKQIGTAFVDTSVHSGMYQYQIKAHFGNQKSYSNIVSVSVPNCTTAITPTPPPPTSGEIKFDAYLTGYGWPDNTPASAAISSGVIHSLAGGVGTYQDPITIAVGHSIISGKDILDYAKGTKFYIPALHRYFIVEDTCGDGSAPQNGPCHSGKDGRPWLDAWVGGQNSVISSVYSCEEKITGVHSVIQNPSPNYLVLSGPIFNSVCTSIFNDVPLLN